MKNLEKIKDNFMDELDEIADKPEFSAGDLETVYKLTCAIANIDKIIMRDKHEYSGDYDGGMWEAMGSYAGGGNRGGNRGGGNMGGGRSNRGSSYARRKRDRMGRYSGDDDTEEMVEMLEDMMKDTDDSRIKSAIKRCITEIEKD